MYSEFDQFSFLATMSNSEFCLYTTTRKDLDSSSLESAANVFQDHVSSPKHRELADYKKETDDDQKKKKRLEQKPSISLGQCSSSDADDGFRTPTSLDHKIPVITHCPPPPRKIFIPSRKRKLESPRILRPRQLLLDLSQEVGSMFPGVLQQDIGRKIKKARRDDDDDALT